MLQKAVASRIGALKLFGISHSDQVRRYAPSALRNHRHDVAPDIRRSRIAMKEHDRRPTSKLHVGHALAVNVTKPLWKLFGRKHARALHFLSRGFCQTAHQSKELSGASPGPAPVGRDSRLAANCAELPRYQAGAGLACEPPSEKRCPSMDAHFSHQKDRDAFQSTQIIDFDKIDQYK
jgi:hypothetical protein